jgi:hypothetical protein
MSPRRDMYGRRSSQVGTSFVVFLWSSAHVALEPSMIFNLLIQLLPSNGSADLFWQPTAKMPSRSVAKSLMMRCAPSSATR